MKIEEFSLDKRLIPYVFIWFVLVTCGSQAQALKNTCVLALMPCPNSISLVEGNFSFVPQMTIYIKGMSQKRKDFALTHFSGQLQRFNNNNKSWLHATKSQVNADIVVIVPNKSQQFMSEQGLYHLPKLGDDESYQLSIKPQQIVIRAASEFGALHGLTTLLQIVANVGDKVKEKQEPAEISLPQLDIVDQPRFQWRGLLIDSVRHFMPMTELKRQLDGMAAAKLNVFHWHLTDDQGWRIESKRYPKLHQLGADQLFYSQAEIIELVDYASLLGIRVVPEFDIPGHASAIAVAYPQLMALSKSYQMQRQWGVFEPLLNVSDESVYHFIEQIVAELTGLFPDEYLHIGGDEVNPKQWLENDDIKQLMADEKLLNGEDIQAYFNHKVQNILLKNNRKMMGWDEIFHPDLSADIVVQSWRGLQSLHQIANQGYQGILSTGFYIDQPQYSAYHYRNDPMSANGVIQHQTTDGKLTSTQKAFAWQLTVPRLKGSAVKGTFILITETLDNTDIRLAGYLKLNNNNYKKVIITKPILSLKQYSPNHVNVISTMDSWMGPLRFEQELIINQQGELIKSKEIEVDDHNSQKTQFYIGNASYPAIFAAVAPPILTEIFSNSAELKNSDSILGGEATLWSELVTKDNIDLRVWPRLFVIAERLWSNQEINDIDNMYQRLFSIDKYAHNTLGLLHKAQQHTGFVQLLTIAEGNTNEAKELISSLQFFSQMFEPAHYYTRHHLKYQQKLYHQQAPLVSFVDFLPVESFPVIQLKLLVERYSNGETSVLSTFINKLNFWKTHTNKLNKAIQNHHKLAHLLPLINQFNEFYRLVSPYIQKCRQGQAYQHEQISTVYDQIKQTRQQQTETILAIIPVVEQLLASCQIHNQ